MVVGILGQLKNKKQYCEEKWELSPRNKKCFRFQWCAGDSPFYASLHVQ